MGRGCSCQMLLASMDTKEAREAVKPVLEEFGFRVSARGRTDAGFRMSGIRGSQFAAILWSVVPFAQLFGIGARVGVRVKCQRSIDEGDERLFFWLNVYPMQEFDDARETWLTSDMGEAIGDHMKSKRIYRGIIDRLADLGIVVPFS